MRRFFPPRPQFPGRLQVFRRALRVALRVSIIDDSFLSLALFWKVDVKKRSNSLFSVVVAAAIPSHKSITEIFSFSYFIGNSLSHPTVLSFRAVYPHL
jgi:hypothetical protein